MHKATHLTLGTRIGKKKETLSKRDALTQLYILSVEEGTELTRQQQKMERMGQILDFGVFTIYSRR